MSDQNLEYDRDRYEPYGVNNIGRGAGITITTGFDVSAQMPLDARTVVETLADLYAMPQDVIYMGLLVYVIEDNKLYQWKEVLQDDKTYEIGWGPIEAEVSAVELDYFKYDNELLEITDEIDFENTPVLMMQKNKDNFFPIVHEDYIYVDKEGETLANKYQTIVDERLATTDKTIAGSVNELNTKMDDTIADFREEIDDTLAELRQNVKNMQDQTAADMAQLKADTEATMAQLKTDTEATMAQLKADTEADFAAMKQEMQDNLDEMNRVLDETMAEINAEMDALEVQIESRVDQMLKDVDNSILSDLAVNNFMEQINANLRALDGDGNVGGGSSSIMTTSFETYSSIVRVNTAVSEVSIAGLGVTIDSSDKLFVHVNSVYLIENVDYRIDTTSQKIICLTGTWNSYNIPGCEFSFDLIKKVYKVE